MRRATRILCIAAVAAGAMAATSAPPAPLARAVQIAPTFTGE